MRLRVVLCLLAMLAFRLGSADDAGPRPGDFPAAITHWSEVIRQSTRQGETALYIQALIRRGEAYRVLGYYREALADFQAALERARQTGDQIQQAVAAGASGHTSFLTREFARAESLLRESLQLAETLDLPGLAAANANHLGNLELNRRRTDAARRLYAQALELAQQGGDILLGAMVRVNLARIADQPTQALRWLRQAYDESQGAGSDHERARLWVSIGYQAQRLEGLTGPAVKARFQLSDSALNGAVTLAKRLGDKRLRSLAQGHLGALYADFGRLAEATALTEQAILAAQALAAHDLLLQWEGQLGRLLRAANNHAAAIAAYRRGVYHIQAVRYDIPIEYHDGRSSFRETLAPIYLSLADLLLQQAAREEDPMAVQRLLTEARDTVELIKTAELQDYFKEPCAVAQAVELEGIAPGTAVLYPIILPDRLELLVSLTDRKYRKTVSVTAQKLEATATNLAFRLRPSVQRMLQSYQRPARQLHEWLINPIAPLLTANDIHTLVFVPDGVLRLVPIAALFDGEGFLVQRYAIVTSAGLTLLDPKPIPRQAMTTLLAGLSKPGPVIKRLPDRWLRYFFTGPLRQLRQRETDGITNIRSLLDRPDVFKEMQAALTLPGVANEVATLSRQLPASVILDEDFVLSEFEKKVLARPYRIVHIASHGVFGGTPEESFIMTYDRRLDMNKLESLLKSEKFIANPVELLTLSACQTSEGDDRSPLGLSGIALKSGARSALGSLWSISDAAAQVLIPEFYAQLSNPELSKAQALQRAQIKLLEEQQFRHPFYWAAFILVGNWL